MQRNNAFHSHYCTLYIVITVLCVRSYLYLMYLMYLPLMYMYYIVYTLGSWDIQVGQQRKKHGQNCVSIGYIDDKKPKIF